MDIHPVHVYELYVLSYNILFGNGISCSFFLVIRWFKSFWLTELFHQWLHIDHSVSPTGNMVQRQYLLRTNTVGLSWSMAEFPWLAFSRIRFFLAAKIAWLIKSPSSHAPKSNKMQTFSKVQHRQATHTPEALLRLYFQCRCKSILYIKYIIVIYYLI